MKTERFDDEDDNSRDDERNRDRAKRAERPSRFSGGGGGGGGGGNNVRERSPRDRKRGSGDRRVYVSNVAYEYKWQELKDLFREEVGEVAYVELFVDEKDKPRGCGIVEFDTAELAKKAVEKMHRFDLKGRKLVVKEDNDVKRDKYGRIITGRSDMNRSLSDSRPRDDRPNWGNNNNNNNNSNNNNNNNNNSGPLFGSSNSGGNKWGNTYGLSPQFLENLGIDGPLVSKVFVANLDYKVDGKKLKEVFKLAGRIINCELSIDKAGKSRGFGVVEYDHPVEAVQAISMLHNQVLYDRRLAVRLDRSEKSDNVSRLPEGLRSLGMGLGSNGTPLADVARNLPSLTIDNNNIGNAVNIASAVPAPLAAAALGPSAASAALGVAGSQLVNSLGVGGLTGSVVGLGNAGVERFLDNNARRQNLGVGGLGNTAGLSSLMTAGGATGLSSLGLGGSGGGFGAGIGNNPFGGGNQLAATNNFLNSSTGTSNLGSGRDFDSLSAALSSGYNTQGINNRDFGANRNVPSSGLGQTGNDNNNSSQMTDAIIVKNLPPNASWQDLKDKCNEAGNVRYAEIRGKDSGLVQFSSQWEANRAINLLDRSRWEGRTLEVRFY